MPDIAWREWPCGCWQITNVETKRTLIHGCDQHPVAEGTDQDATPLADVVDIQQGRR